MMPSVPPRFLHVANGTCTTMLIEAAGIPGAVSIWADPLYEGPVPGGLNDEELLIVRARYLAGPDEETPTDPVNDLKLWRKSIADHESYDELVLWFEHDLFDQLNLIQLLSWIRRAVPDGKPVSLVCIGSFPGHPRFKGLGELEPNDLLSLLDTRERVSDAQYDVAERAWLAFREATPEALERLLRTDTSALPFLSAAVRRFLEDYPSTTDGLSRTERRLLQLAESGPIDLLTAFPRMHDGEKAYYITDLSLAALAETFSKASVPLIALDQDAAAAHPLRATMSITPAGRAVLAGKIDRVATCPIDRWLGGVHLQGTAVQWRWDSQQERIARS